MKKLPNPVSSSKCHSQSTAAPKSPPKITPGEKRRRPPMQGGGVFLTTPSLWFLDIVCLIS